MADMIKVEDGVMLISSMDVAKGFNIEHAAVLRLVQKYKEDFQQIRAFNFKSQKSGGRPMTFCMLDEQQAAFLATLFRNSKLVVSFKRRITTEFYKLDKSKVELCADITGKSVITEIHKMIEEGK